eukprot:gene2930-3216_t
MGGNSGPDHWSYWGGGYNGRIWDSRGGWGGGGWAGRGSFGGWRDWGADWSDWGRK